MLHPHDTTNDPLASLTLRRTVTRSEVSDAEGIAILEKRQEGFPWSQIYHVLKDRHPTWGSEGVMRSHFLSWLEKQLRKEDISRIRERLG